MRNRIDTILQLEKGHEKSKITVGDDKIMSLLAHLIESLQQGEELCVNSSRFYFMMNPASLPHAKLMRAIELIGTHVAPALRKL